MLSGLPCICKVCNRLWKEYDGKNGEDQRRRPRWCRRLHVCAAPRAGQALGRSALANFLREVLTRLRQRMDGSARSMEFKYGLNERELSTKRARSGLRNHATSRTATISAQAAKTSAIPNEMRAGLQAEARGGPTRPVVHKAFAIIWACAGSPCRARHGNFLIATINPIEMSKTESAKFTRRSRPELIAR